MSGYGIKTVTGLEIIDSRGNPTVEATVELENGVAGSGAVPSGAACWRGAARLSGMYLEA